jgi:guanine deaminase
MNAHRDGRDIAGAANPDAAFVRRAIQLAREHMLAGHGGPFGALVVCDGEIIGQGWNQVTSVNDPTAHAEIVAIRAAAANRRTFQLAGCILYCSCEPCPMCLGAAYWARLDRVVFAGTRCDAAAAGFDDEELYRELARPIPQRRLKQRQILREEMLPVFAEWHAKPDKVLY